MEIIDAHFHFGDKIYDESLFLQYLYNSSQVFQKNNISKAITMITPMCKDRICSFDSNHLTFEHENNGSYELECVECNRIIKRKNIPFYRDANLQLLSAAKSDERIIPFFTTSVLKPDQIIKELDWITSNFPKKVKGIKIYTGNSDVQLNSILPFSDLPLIIHTGIYPNQDLKSMIKFITKYNGPIQLAHFGRFDEKSIRQFTQFDNIYFDCSPAKYLFENKSRKLFKHDFQRVEELFYYMFDMVGIDKVVFGSDYPYGNIEEEIGVINSLKISEFEKQSILSKNIERFLNL